MMRQSHSSASFPLFIFFNDTATTEIYTLSLHDALPISERRLRAGGGGARALPAQRRHESHAAELPRAGDRPGDVDAGEDRKSTRLNSSHANISYAVFCLKKKKNQLTDVPDDRYMIFVAE